MITNFALSLSFDGIELLHRVPRGWRRVGQVDVASKTLDEDLSTLRKKAQTIEPDGLRTKLVIPLDQIKYIAIDGTLTTDEDIEAALEGATPYTLDELVIDSEKFGGRTHVAAVARETLQEAEAFAAAHGFQPIAFVAVPEPFTFQKEVFFGPTDMARSVVGPDALIERDDLPVMVVGTRIKSRLLVMDLPQDVEEEVYKDDLTALLEAVKAPVPDTDIAVQDEEEVFVATVEDTPKATPSWIDRIPAEYHAPVTADAEPEAASEPVSETLIPSKPAFASLPLFDPIIAEYRPPRPRTPKPLLVAISRASLNAAPETESEAPATQAEPDTTLPRTAPAAPTANRARAPKPANDRKRPALIVAGIAAGLLVLGGVFWSQQGAQEIASVPETTAIDSTEVVTQAPENTERAIEAATATEVGPAVPEFEIGALEARDDDATDLPRLTADIPTQPLSQPAALSAATADTPIVTVEAPPAPPSEETAPATVGAPVLRGQVPSPDEAARIYEATGVWQRAPRFIDVPSGMIPFSFQPPVGTTPPDRIAQPEIPLLEGLDTDLSFIAPANPPAPDVVFPRDADGFILATEQGTVTPEGAIVIAGLPDLAITPRPTLSQNDLDRMALLAPAPEGVIIIAGRPDIVPPLRPADAQLSDVEESPLAEDAIEAALADAATQETPPSPGGVGLSNLELQNSGAIAVDPAVFEDGAIVDLRPRLRPQGLAPARDSGTPDITDIIAGIETDDATLRFDNSTALAVVLSLRPDVRPANFGNVVAAARARQQTRPVSTAAPVAAAAPVPPQNFEPVPGGVARAATQEDAIRLRQINLIGVYGRANARRALVRLGNGRYVRVEVGSALDGGQVTAIGENALNYVKRGRTYAIALPSD